MKHHWLEQKGTAELLLLFGGWGLGLRPFEGPKRHCDTCFIEDYTRLDVPAEFFAAYDHITLLSYSFGVASSLHWLDETGAKVDRFVAVNGTPHPASETMGIAPATVRATIDGLSPASFAKFCKRAGMKAQAPVLDISAAQNELDAILTRGSAGEIQCDRIWISQRDRIIPSAHQQAAWSGQSSAIQSTDAPHLPFDDNQSWKGWIA